MVDLTVIIPCYREDEKLVTELYCNLSLLGCRVIVVDDGGDMFLPDDVNCIRYRPNMGYGYAIKEGLKQVETPIVCTIDGDGEHAIEDVQKLYTMFKMIPDCAMVVGCRWNKKESKLRWFGRKVINSLAMLWSRHLLLDLNSGLRMFRKDLAIGYKDILCDTFSFTTSLTMALVTDGHKVAWFPINSNPRVYGKSRVRLLRDSMVTIFYIFWIGFALRTRKLRASLRFSYHA